MRCRGTTLKLSYSAPVISLIRTILDQAPFLYQELRLAVYFLDNHTATRGHAVQDEGSSPL